MKLFRKAGGTFRNNCFRVRDAAGALSKTAGDRGSGGIPRVLCKLRTRRMRSWRLRGKLFPIAGHGWPSACPRRYSASDASMYSAEEAPAEAAQSTAGRSASAGLTGAAYLALCNNRFGRRSIRSKWSGRAWQPSPSTPAVTPAGTNGSGQRRIADGCRPRRSRSPARHRDTRKFTRSRFTVPTRIARLPGERQPSPSRPAVGCGTRRSLPGRHTGRSHAAPTGYRRAAR